MHDIIKTVKSLGDLGLLTDGATETVKDEKTKQEGEFLGAMMAPVAASLINAISAKGVMRMNFFH